MTTAKITSLTLTIALLGATACGDDDGEAQPTTRVDAGGFTSDARVEDEKDSGGGGGNTDDEDGGVDEDGGEDADGGGQNCEGPEGCYACKPSTNAQFLNACVDSASGIVQLRFENAERIPNFDPNNPLGT